MRKAIALLYQVSMSFYAPIPAILAIKLGMSPLFVGFLIALRSFIQQLGNLFWPKYVTQTQRAGVVSLGFFGIMLGALLLTNSKTLIPAVIVMALLPRGTYFYLLDEVRRNTSNLKKDVSEFYRINTYGTLSGMLLGAITSHNLSATELPLILFIVSAFSTIILSSIMGEEGLLPIFRKGLVEIKSIDQSIRTTKFRVRGLLSMRDFVPYLSTSALFSLGFSLVYPQFPLFVGILLGNPSLYYVFAVISRVFSIAGYSISHKVKRALLWGWTLRSVMYIAWLLAFKNPLLVYLAFALSGFGWSFLNTFYETENLTFGHQLTSLNHFSRGTAYSIGSIFSGYLISQSMLLALVSSFGLIIVSPLPFLISNILKKATSNNETGPVAQTVRAPVL